MRTARTVVAPLPSRVITVIGSSSAVIDRESTTSAIAQTPMRRMACEYHGFARETIGTLLFTAHDADVSDYMLPRLIARMDRESHTSVVETRRVNQIVHYLGRVYFCIACGADRGASSQAVVTGLRRPRAIESHDVVVMPGGDVHLCSHQWISRGCPNRPEISVNQRDWSPRRTAAYAAPGLLLRTHRRSRHRP